MKRAIVWVLRFVYKYSGLAWVVSEVQTFVLNYRLRLRFVPVSYKLFLVLLGVSLGSGWQTAYQMYQNTVEAQKWSFEQPYKVETALAATEEEAKPQIVSIEDLADKIHHLESSKGKNNFSKCAAQGKYNEYGFGIPGNGSFVCFDKQGDDRTAVIGWLTHKRAAGMSDTEMLCLYSGRNYSFCK